MQIISKILISLLFVTTCSMADAINAEFSNNSFLERLYQTQSTESDTDNTDNDSNEDSSGTPIDLILEVEPEC